MDRVNRSFLATLSTPLRLILNDARVSGPLLVALVFFPEKLKSIVPARLFLYLTSTTFIRTLAAFFSLGIARKVNSALSSAQLNNWKGSAKFGREDELVLISGGSSGIGLLVAERFAELGVEVVIVDLNPPRKALPAGISFYQLDVTSSSQIAEVAKEIRKAHADPTVLINNAGVAFCRPILGGGARTEEAIRRTFEVNAISHFWMVREFVPAMIKKNHGHVVTISSMAAFVVHAQNVDYSCTKTAVQAFHEGLASELKHIYKAPDVKTTIVHPTWVRTPFIGPLTSNPDFKDLVLEPEYVATEIVNQVVSGRSAQLILPPQHTLVSGLRGWPSWFQERLRNKMGYTLLFYKEWEKDGAVP